MTSRLGVTFAALLCLVGSAFADKAPPAKKPPATKPTPPPAAGSGSAAGSAAEAPEAPEALPPGIHMGPAVVDIGNNSEVDVPAGMLMLEKAQAQEMLRKGGDNVDSVVGVIGQKGKEWLVIIEFDGDGYVDDDDADKLDAAELLKSYEEGTAAQNAVRRQNGIAELFVDGWSENPKYERAKHHLVWGLKAHSRQAADPANPTVMKDAPVVNYFTRVLGRSGWLSINLIDGAERIEASKVEVAGVLQAVRFKAGWRYEDHKSEDKSSGMGLRALVLGGAGVALATKGGFLIKLLLIFKKAIIFIVVGIGGLFKWLFGRKKKEDEPMVINDPPHDPPHDPNGPPPSV